MSASYRTYVVVNPRSAGGDTSRRWQTIASRLDDCLDEWTHAFTEGPIHATELTRAALRDGWEMVVACGGDGTINEVVNGFFDGTQPVVEQPILGLLPSGTGGDFRKTWDLSREPEEALRRLGGKQTTPVDCGRVTLEHAEPGDQVRYFANIASFGVSALVCKNVNESSKMLGGRLSFMGATIRALWGYSKQPVVLVTDGVGQREETVTVCALCIGRYFGGGMKIGPQAEPNDGLLDVVSMSLGRKDLLRMSAVYKGEHLNQSNCSFWRGKAVHAHVQGGDQEMWIELDGEVVGQLPARFECIPNAYRIKV